MPAICHKITPLSVIHSTHIYIFGTALQTRLKGCFATYQSLESTAARGAAAFRAASPGPPHRPDLYALPLPAKNLASKARARPPRQPLRSSFHPAVIPNGLRLDYKYHRSLRLHLQPPEISNDVDVLVHKAIGGDGVTETGADGLTGVVY